MTMSPLTPEACGTILKDNYRWFGPPALLRKPPSQFNLDPVNLCEELTYILDGGTRFASIVTSRLRGVWVADDLPFYVFNGENLYSTEGRKLLPRMLVLAGHYDRAPKYIPEPWSSSVPDLAAFLNVTEYEATQVYVATRIDLQRRRMRQLTEGQSRHRYNERIVHAIRAGLAARAEMESDFDWPDVARLVEYKGAMPWHNT